MSTIPLDIVIKAQNQANAAFAQVVAAQNKVKLAADQATLAYDRYVQAMTKAKATQSQMQVAADQVAIALDKVKIAESGVATAAERARAAQEQATSAMQRETEAARQEATAQTRVSEATHKSSISFSEMASRIGATITGVQSFIQMALGAVQGLSGLTQSLISSNASMEQATIAMKTLLPAGQQATAMITQLWQFAAKTPFQFPDIDAAAQKLIAFGTSARDVIPDLTAIGDSLSALGRTTPAALQGVVSIFGKIQTQGRMMTRDMMMLSNYGINAWSMLEKQLHLTHAQLQTMITKGLIPANVAISALRNGMEGKFGGGMEKQAQTFNGLMTTVKDNAMLALRSFTGPIFDAAKSGLQSLGNLVSSKGFQQFATTLGHLIAPAMKAVATGAGQVIAGLQKWMGQKSTIDGLKSAFAAIATIGREVGRVIQQIGDAVRPTAQEFQKWATQNNLLQNVMHAVVGAIRLVGAVLSFVIPIMLAISKAIWQLILDIGARLRPILQQFAAWWKAHWTQIQAILVGVWNFIQGAVKEAWAVVSGIIKIGLDILGGNWKQAWADIQDTLKNVWDGFKQMIGGALQAIINLLLGAGEDIFKSIVTPFVDAWNAIAGVFGQKPIDLNQLLGQWSVNFMGSSSTPLAKGGESAVNKHPGKGKSGTSGSPGTGTSGSGSTDTSGLGTGTGTGKGGKKAQLFTAADIADLVANARAMGLKFNKALFEQMSATQRIKYIDQLVGDSHKKLAELLKKTHKGLADYVLWYIENQKKGKGGLILDNGVSGSVVTNPVSASKYNASFIMINNVSILTNAKDGHDLYNWLLKRLELDLRRSGQLASMASGGKAS